MFGNGSVEGDPYHAGAAGSGYGAVHAPLKKQPEVLDAWSDTIRTVMVEKVLVHKDGQLTFGLYNGSEIRIGA